MVCGCFGTLQEVKLVNDCYPPSKALLASAPDYKPLSSDLSKLTYRCTNQSSKLAKVGEELERRIHKEAIKSTGGYPKSRASLLISLAILRALINECRRDLALFSRSIIRSINAAIDVKVYQKGDPDLEVVGRAASCFIAFVTYTDGVVLRTDEVIGSTYLSVLSKFASLSTFTYPAQGEKPDPEPQNRTRLIGLAALNGASSSDALFSSHVTQFPKQASIIIPAICANIFSGSISTLKTESAKIEMDASPSPYFSEFSTRRPVNDRRAPSLHAHIPGEKGPSEVDVLSAALRSLNSMVRQCQTVQATSVLDAMFIYLDKIGWADVERSCWLAERLAAMMSLQYRFVIPTRLTEMLVDLPNGPVTHKHTTILAMITTILSSSTSLVGLGVTDLTNNLITIITQRIQFDTKDGLLPPLVECIASLGTHIYYADQINDIIEEIAVRMSELDVDNKARPEILRVLIHCMIGVMTTANAVDMAEAKSGAHDTSAGESSKKEKEKGKAPQLEGGLPEHGLPRRSGRRKLISTQIWQETLPLLCESTFPVRQAYARALLLFLTNELPREAKPMRPGNTSLNRFVNALSASIYTLAMSSCLGAASRVPSPVLAEAPAGTKDGTADSPAASRKPSQPEINLNDEATKGKEDGRQQLSAAGTGQKPVVNGGSTDRGVSFAIQEPTPSQTPRTSSPGQMTPTRRSAGTSTPPRKPTRITRRVSLPLNRLNSSLVVGSFDNVATPFDFSNIIEILDQLNKSAPTATLLIAGPMLIALDRDASTELVRRPGDGRQGAWVFERKRSIRETISIIWKHLARTWNIDTLVDYAEKQMNTLPEPFEVPNPLPTPQGILPPPDIPAQFVPNPIEGESSSSSKPFLDPETLIPAVTSSSTVQSSTTYDSTALSKRFGAKWTVESALKDSVERFSSAQVSGMPDDTHFDVANVLMSMNNSSYQSFNRPTSKAVDVTDLREALGGRMRTDSYNGSTPPSIISTATTGGMRSVHEITPKKKGIQNNDVQEVLKDIFKGTKKRGGNMRKSLREAVDNAKAGTSNSNTGDTAPSITANPALGNGTTASKFKENGIDGRESIELGPIAPSQTNSAVKVNGA